RIAGRLAAERVEVRGEVAEVAVRANEGVGGSDMPQIVDTRLWESGDGRCTWRRRSGLRRSGAYLSLLPAPNCVHAFSDQLVEPFLALQQGIEGAEKHPRLRPLDDPVVVGARDRDDFRAGDIADRTGRDDRALAFHEAWNRCHGAERAGIGELDGAAREVVRHQ